MECNNVKLIQGDCLDRLLDLQDCSVDSIVTDPPYELGFMGRKWDSSGIANNVELWEQCLRVLKPGGHLLAFGGTRTYHRMTVAIEDAGFEIRDCIQWLYGSGFPKSLDVSKAIDKAAGAEREVTGQREVTRDLSRDGRTGDEAISPVAVHGATIDVTAPALPEAKQWEGWGTALKPANEPIVVARKPLAEKTVAANVLKWGTGAININGCRVEGAPWAFSHTDKTSRSSGIMGDVSGAREGVAESHSSGRWPANVLFDERAAESLGEPSRFFYVAKASGKERTAGLENMPDKKKPGWSSGELNPGSFQSKMTKKEAKNVHPTVKPITLMRYLCRLVTPPGGTVLDPFTGSGSTGCGAVLEGFDFVGIEREEEYIIIAEARISHWNPWSERE
jgi:site-specific DNA-methyltransferase (adenine-specific)